MKEGYYVEIAGYYLIVNKVLQGNNFLVETGFVVDGNLEVEEGGVYSKEEIEIWEKETRTEMEEYEKQVNKEPIDEFGRPLIEKNCVGCGGYIQVIAEYDVCDICADRREKGADF